MKDLTFNDLPQAIIILYDKIASIEQILLNGDTHSKIESDELLTVQDAAKFLRLSVPTIYGLIGKGEIPFMKRSKRCYFSKQDLINYLKAGRRKTVSELAVEADLHLKKGMNGDG